MQIIRKRRGRRKNNVQYGACIVRFLWAQKCVRLVMFVASYMMCMGLQLSAQSTLHTDDTARAFVYIFAL